MEEKYIEPRERDKKREKAKRKRELNNLLVENDQDKDK